MIAGGRLDGDVALASPSQERPYCDVMSESRITLGDLNEDGRPELLTAQVDRCKSDSYLANPGMDDLWWFDRYILTESGTPPLVDSNTETGRPRYLRFSSNASVFHAKGKMFKIGDSVTCDAVNGNLEEVVYVIDSHYPLQSKRVAHLKGIPEKEFNLSQCTVAAK